MTKASKTINTGIAVCLSLLSANAVTAETPVSAPLLPTSSWRVDYAEQECRLTRSFGEKDALILFRLARGTSFDNYDVMLAGLSIPKFNGKVDVEMTLEPQNSTTTFAGRGFPIPNRKERVVNWYDGSITAISGGPKDQVMLVKIGTNFSVRLKLDDLRPAIAATKTCHDDLLRGWKIDTAALSTLKRHAIPIGSPGTWATTDDYPMEAIRANMSGQSSFLLTVGKDGKPMACSIFVSSKAKLLDDTTCRVVKLRARFTPAIGADGTAVESVYINRVRWVLP
jgi:Gram-negative bacterial TonB protein C-terminal